MDSEGRIIEVVLGTEFSDYDRRTGNNKTRPKNWCRQFARKVSVYDSVGRLAVASERTASGKNLQPRQRHRKKLYRQLCLTTDTDIRACR